MSNKELIDTYLQDLEKEINNAESHGNFDHASGLKMARDMLIAKIGGANE